MIMIKKKVLYDDSIYSRDALYQAINSYIKICRITPRATRNGVVCTFSADADVIDTIIHEFDNYLIELLSRGSVS